MEKMLNPEIEWIKFSMEDIITTSKVDNEHPVNQPGDYNGNDDTQKDYGEPKADDNLPDMGQ